MTAVRWKQNQERLEKAWLVPAVEKYEAVLVERNE